MAKPPIQHELTYRAVEDDYADGLDDAYDCTCGETFRANGDVAEAFEHGYEAGLAHGLECDEPTSHLPQPGATSDAS